MASGSNCPPADDGPSPLDAAAIIEDSIGALRRALDNAVLMGDYQTGFALMTTYDALNSELRGYYSYMFTAARTADMQASGA